MIGLTLSGCVRDIATGVVALDQVEKVIAGTRAENPDDWDKIIASYRENCWYGGHADEGERIARTLIAEGKVEQPRLEGKPLPVIWRGNGNWAENEAAIEWDNPL